jgi:hypothetical protein
LETGNEVVVVRVTIDLDTHNLVIIFFALSKGCILCKRLPYFIRLTRRGVHFGFRHLSISREICYKYRYIIGDDINRIKLDQERTIGIQQVLFTHKTVWRYPDGKKTLVTFR